MKILARDDQTRPQDRLDLRALFSQANEQEREVARLALAEICAHGYNRGRLLEVELEAAEVEFKQCAEEDLRARSGDVAR
ncbi:MAG: hypothetical protein U0931_35405 [Vulcanimicrobiota bacterium]